MPDEDHGLRPIGPLTSSIASSLPNGVSTPTRSPAPSETTGSPRQELTPASGIGTQSGETGVAAPPNLPTVLISGPLAGADPEKTDAVLLANLGQQLGQPLVLRTESFIDPHYGWDYRVTGYELAARLEVTRLQRARKLAAIALAPAPPKMVVEELARLRMLTKSRAGDETDRELTYVALAEELVEFPPDVIRSALRKIARRETFFPSLAEMIDQCQREVRNRRLIARAIGLED